MRTPYIDFANRAAQNTKPIGDGSLAFSRSRVRSSAPVPHVGAFACWLLQISHSELCQLKMRPMKENEKLLCVCVFPIIFIHDDFV